jgi:hypothetical protein
MKRVIPYEHKGLAFRNIKISGEEDARKTLELFESEKDIWLKKILAQKLIEAARIYHLEISERLLGEATKCRIE